MNTIVEDPTEIHHSTGRCQDPKLGALPFRSRGAGAGRIRPRTTDLIRTTLTFPSQVVLGGSTLRRCRTRPAPLPDKVT
jgi:hypothetical protein